MADHVHNRNLSSVCCYKQEEPYFRFHISPASASTRAGYPTHEVTNVTDTTTSPPISASRPRRAAADLSTQRGKNLALVLLAMTQFVVVIDASIVNVALPSIGAHLHFSRDDLSWVVNAYTLTFGGFLLLGGRLADLLGRRRMFIVGLVAVLARLARRRPRAVGGVADHRPRGPGPRRGDRLAGGAVDHHDDVRRRRTSATARSASGARSRARAAPRACCSAASSRAG